MTQGFTLIELLVVVLIIGILSSIALPQYEKSVRRARGAEAVLAAKTVADSANLYFFERHQYTTNLADLTVEAPALKNFTLTLDSPSNSILNIIITASSGEAAVTIQCERGKVVSRTCAGADCADYFASQFPACGATI